MWGLSDREDAHSERHYDFRPKKATERKTKKIKDPRLIEMREKLLSEEAKAIYSRRNHTVETAFGIIKEVMGFRGFMLRGLEKVTGEWKLVGLSYNLKRLHNLKKAAKAPNEASPGAKQGALGKIGAELATFAKMVIGFGWLRRPLEARSRLISEKSPANAICFI